MQLESHLQASRATRYSSINIRWGWTAAGVALIVWSLIQAGVFSGQTLINTGGWTLVLSFLQAALHPQLSPEFLTLTLHSALITLGYAFCGTSLSLIIGVIGGVLSSDVWWQAMSPTRHGRGIWWTIRAGLSVPRAIHELIWGIFFINILGLNPLVAILAIAIPFGAITAKVFSEILDEMPRAPLRALLNNGASPFAAFFYSILPQSIPNILSYTFYRLECSIRSAAVLGVIGAGGLGYQLWLSFQSLRYDEMWTFIFALIFLIGAVDIWSSQLRRRFGSSTRLDVANCQSASSIIKPIYRRDRAVTLSLIVMAILIPLSFWYVQADFSTLFAPRAAKLFASVINDSFPPALDAALIKELSHQTIQTFAISILAITLAGIGGLLFSFPAAQNRLTLTGVLNPQDHTVMTLLILVPTRLLLLTFRAIPASVWALLLLFVLFPGILPGAIALGIYTLGILGRLMAEVIESLDERPLIALRSCGASGAQIFFYGVLPRAMPLFLSNILYRWEVSVRETVIIGVVGAAGLGRVLAEQLSNFDYAGMTTTLLFFIALTVFADVIGVFARRAMQ